MRTLTGGLLEAQKKRSIAAKGKVVFTHASPPGAQAGTYTYTDGDTLLEIKDHKEEPYTQKADAILTNYDQGMNAIDLKGYTGTISYGAYVKSGPELVTNGGGAGQTDWVDGNTDGLADSWTKEANVTATIVTGDGWSGSAQKAAIPSAYTQGIWQEIGWANGTQYRITFKYMTEGAATSASIRSMSAGGNNNLQTLPVTNGEINSYSWEGTPAAGQTRILFTSTNSGQGASSITIDELSVKEIISGDVYSACAPLRVISQKFDSDPSNLNCILECVGIPDLLAEDKASVGVTPASGDAEWSWTVKDWIQNILDATLGCYSHCVAYTVAWDSEDAIIDSHLPRDGFRIHFGGSRLAAVRRLLDYTQCLMRVEDDGEVHIFQPTITGTTYDYEYKLLVAGEHSFFSKAYRNTLVIPNYVHVENLLDGTAYTGEAEDTGSSDVIGEIRRFYRFAVTSDAECDSIAAAMLAKFTLNSQRGSLSLPIMNVGQEVGDYIKVTDSRLGLDRVGNVASLTRHFKRGVQGKDGIFSLSFSFGGWISMDPLLKNLETYGDEGKNYGRITAESIDITLDDVRDGGSFHRVASASLTAAGLVIVDQLYINGGNTAIGSYELVLSTQISAGKIELTSTSFLINEDNIRAGTVANQRLAITYEGIKGYNSSNVLQVHIDATDGSLLGGAGEWILDATGMHIYGDITTFYDPDTPFEPRGFIDCTSTDFAIIAHDNLGGTINLQLSASKDFRINIEENNSFAPMTDGQGWLGTASLAWKRCYAEEFHGDGSNLTNVPGYVSGDSPVFTNVEINGALNHDGSTVGLFGVTPATRPVKPADWGTSHSLTGGSTINTAGLETLLDYYGGLFNLLMDRMAEIGSLTS